METATTKLGIVMADFLRDQYAGEIPIHNPRSALTLDLPVCVVFVEESRPIAPYEPVHDCIVRVAVMHDAELTPPLTAAEDSSEVFAAIDESAFSSFALSEGLEISTMHLDSEGLTMEEMRWVHAQRLRVIAALSIV